MRAESKGSGAEYFELGASISRTRQRLPCASVAAWSHRHIERMTSTLFHDVFKSNRIRTAFSGR